MFKHILLPIDGSDPSAKAIDLAIDVARQHNARMSVLHVVAPLPGVEFFTEKLTASKEPYTNEVIRRAQQYLEIAREKVMAAGVPCDACIECDSRPYAAIVCAVSKYECDLIVVGSHGRTGLDRLRLGSETKQILLCSSVPVLVCR